MPLYECRCDKCGKNDEVFRKIADSDKMPDCCGSRMTKILSAPEVMSDINPYQSQATGEWITSRSKHRDHLKSRGLIEIGDQHHAHQRSLEENKKAEEKKQSKALRQEIAERLYSHG